MTDTKLTTKQQAIVDALAQYDTIGFGFFDAGLAAGSEADSQEVYEYLVAKHGGTAKAWGAVVGRMNKLGLTSRTYDGTAFLQWNEAMAQVLQARHEELAPAGVQVEEPQPAYTAKQLDFLRVLADTASQVGPDEKVTTEAVYGRLVALYPDTTARSWSSVGASLARKTGAFRTDDYSRFYIITNAAFVEGWE